MIALVINYKTYSKVIKKLEKFWSFEQSGKAIRPEIAVIQKNIKRLYIIFFISVWITGGLYMIRPILEIKKDLPAVWYEICDLSKGLCFRFSFLTQLTNISGLCWTNIGYDGLFLVLLTYAYCDLKMIKDDLLNLDIEEGDEEEVFKAFNIIAEQHNYVME